MEVPITTVSLLGRKFPGGGGGFFRLFPYSLSRALIRRVNAADGHSAIFYFHPWEIDPEQPRIQVGRLKAYRHYHNLDRTESRLESLLAEFRFATIKEVLGL